MSKQGVRMRQIPAEAEDSRAATTVKPSADLLDRARIGWERFLDSFEGASDE
ncbi:hypothetical protein [Streptomyces lavendulae]|uniref:hypothetical protein n=1 Tax=Streptomyces lavendulae TaxID=1914 RepID=UPI0036C3ECC9